MTPFEVIEINAAKMQRLAKIRRILEGRLKAVAEADLELSGLNQRMRFIDKSSTALEQIEWQRDQCREIADGPSWRDDEVIYFPEQWRLAAQACQAILDDAAIQL